MRKKMKIVFSLSLFILISILFYKINSKLDYKKEVTERIKTIPKFSFRTLKNKFYTEKNIQNKPTIFIYFNSDCDFCHHEAKSISKNLNKFKKVQFIFVSFEETEEIKKFAELYKLDNQENIIFLEDKKGVFSTTFNANSIPYILIYNKNKELIKKHNGQLNANGILRVLNQND
jgi:cytochrome oxidase Cu insertion factor (SCO1/SenC/PrrC family)